ncbi:MAG: acyl-CoA dehydrogenase family protein, partial [Syntrophales bacterium]
SEPGAGSDLAGLTTTAVRDGDEWVVNGQKVWNSFAHLADWGILIARTDWDVPKHRGLTWFVVRTDAAGLTINRLEQIDGSAGFCEEFLDDVVVSTDDLIGEVGQGWSVAQTQTTDLLKKVFGK